MRLFSWLLRAFLFFVLFAFALNNQHTVVLHWFFGLESRAPMVLVVLGAFAAGALLGVLAMLPNWWRHRRVLPKPEKPVAEPVPAVVTGAPAEIELTHPPRDGL